MGADEDRRNGDEKIIKDSDDEDEEMIVSYSGRLGYKKKGKPTKVSTILIFVGSIGGLTTWLIIAIKVLIEWLKK